ncbi:flavoprotein [Kitasatospora sp. NPDC059795]|uniref:flavoprotein n=1 Tax=Kitasatospora sp. NPDC059795 TaxID=3346949 RepID=UPI0036653394
MENGGAGRPVVYLFGSAAGAVFGLPDAVREARARGWEAAVGLTPAARGWLEAQVPQLEELTGYPVKSAYRWPGRPDVLPPPDAVLFAPVTFNSFNSLALGLTTSWVVGYAAEALGKGIPVLVMPCVNEALAAHPQFARSVATLREAGAHILLGEEGTGDGSRPFPWDAGLRAVERVLGR